MKLKFIETGSAKDGKTVVDIPKNPYLGCILRLTGTTDTGQTLAEDDIGDIRVERNGSQIQSESFAFYHNYNNMKSGFPATFSGSAATSEDVICFIPFFALGIRNVLDVMSKEEVDITLNFDGTTLSTRFGANAATYELYGVVEPAVAERYTLDIRSQDVQKGSSGRFQEVLDRENIGALYFQDESDVVDELQVDVDGEIVFDNIDQDLITIVSNLANRIETSGFTIGELSLVETGDIREAYNKNTKLDITYNASGTLNVTIFSVAGSPNQDVSRQRAQEYLRRKEQVLSGRTLN